MQREMQCEVQLVTGLGHVTKQDVVALKRALRKVQDATLPRYCLQLTRFRSLVLSDIALAADTRLQTISFFVALVIALAQALVAVWLSETAARGG